MLGQLAKFTAILTPPLIYTNHPFKESYENNLFNKDSTVEVFLVKLIGLTIKLAIESELMSAHFEVIHTGFMKTWKKKNFLHRTFPLFFVDLGGVFGQSIIFKVTFYPLYFQDICCN